MDPQLEPVNERLGEYNAQWDELVDAWLVLKVSSSSCGQVLLSCSSHSKHYSMTA